MRKAGCYAVNDLNAIIRQAGRKPSISAGFGWLIGIRSSYPALRDKSGPPWPGGFIAYALRRCQNGQNLANPRLFRITAFKSFTAYRHPFLGSGPGRAGPDGGKGYYRW
jgi:hypothetical protein